MEIAYTLDNHELHFITHKMTVFVEYPAKQRDAAIKFMNLT